MQEVVYDGKTSMWSDMPDELLARHAATGSLDAFEELLRRYRKHVYRICYRMAGNADDAEDWAQECFVRVYRQLAHYNPKMPFAPWLLRVVSNACVNLSKSRQAQRGKVDVGFEEKRELTGNAPDPLEVTLRTEEARRIQAAVANLAPPLRQAVVLRVVEGLSFHELAETLGVPLQTAASRVRRAMIQIRERLEQIEIEVKR